jgi:hypothetical protein
MAEDQFQRFSDRFFRVSPLFTEAGWYVKLRDGDVRGPFPSREAAQAMLFTLFGITPEMSEGRIYSTAENIPELFSGNSRTSMA